MARPKYRIRPPGRGVTDAFNSSSGGSDVRTISAKVTSVTAGVTLPLSYGPPAYAGDRRAPLVTKNPVVVASSHWDGFYAALSGGGSWLRGDINEPITGPFSSSSSNFDAITGAVTRTAISNGFDNTFDTASGRKAGAVLTSTVGYNFVWNRWLAGIQSEVSKNFNQTSMQGTSVTNSFSTNQQIFPTVTTPTTNAFTQLNRPPEFGLNNTWTISEMARIGYLAGNDWLIYGLIGGSVGGFQLKKEFDSRETPFTVTGVTYGGGVERDFGWLRGFLQVKVIDYGAKDLVRSNAQTRSDANTEGGVVTSLSATTRGGTDVRTVSAHVTTLTAGVTVPFNTSPR
jgi:hypothetical protein